MNNPSNQTVFIVALVAFCLYYNTLDAGFVYDDRYDIILLIKFAVFKK